MASNRQLREVSKVLQMAAAQCGLDGVGIAPAFPVPVDEEKIRHAVEIVPPDLDYLRRRLEERLNPRLVAKWVRSVIVVFVSYGGTLPGAKELPLGRGFISRFAWSFDYHNVVGERVRRFANLIGERLGARTKWFVDTGPVLEKAYAVAAGLGFQGKNSLFITPKYGSFIFLGTVLTDLDTARENDGKDQIQLGCGGCMACVKACPTGALATPYVLDQSKCLAYLLVSKKVAVSKLEEFNLSGNLFGCDICQDVCPWNARALRPDRLEFLPLPRTYMPRLSDILSMDEKAFSTIFGPTPVRRRGLSLLKATAAVLAEMRARVR